MAVAAKVDAPTPVQDSEAQARLRRAINDVTRQLRYPSKAELLQVREDLERQWIVCSAELRRLAKPLTVKAPRLLGREPEPTPERLAQLAAIDYGARLLEQANQVRAEANLALFQLR